jgi:hypothetical protein
MGIRFKRYKSKFRFALKPFFVMISDKRKDMSESEWRELIRQTQISVLTNPVDFLGDDLPDPNLMRDVLDEIFAEFLKERAFLERSILRMRG